MMRPFTAEELAEMAAADAEIERGFRLTERELRDSRRRDRSVERERKTAKEKKIADQQRGAALWRFRRSLGLSQEAFGREVGVTQKAVSCWELAQVPFDPERIAKIWPGFRLWIGEGEKV